MTTLSEQLEDLGKELRKLAAVRGRWMHNIWFESAIMASVVCFLLVIVLAMWPTPTTPIPSTETPPQRTIYPSMYQDYP